MDNLMGERVRAARERRGWSQRELSRRAGVAGSMVCKLESLRNDPLGGQLRPLVRVARTLRLSLDSLVKDIDAGEPKRHKTR